VYAHLCTSASQLIRPSPSPPNDPRLHQRRPAPAHQHARPWTRKGLAVLSLRCGAACADAESRRRGPSPVATQNRAAFSDSSLADTRRRDTEIGTAQNSARSHSNSDSHRPMYMPECKLDRRFRCSPCTRTARHSFQRPHRTFLRRSTACSCPALHRTRGYIRAPRAGGRSENLRLRVAPSI
jgi:hypothetical protein